MASINRRGTTAQFGVAIRAMVFLTLLLGLIYPLAMTGVGQALFHSNANGSMVQVTGKDVASDLIGQAYTKQAVKDGMPEVDVDGEPVMVADPMWFQTRPSAVDYDGAGSAASQYGPNNADLLAAVQERRKTVAELEGSTRRRFRRTPSRPAAAVSTQTSAPRTPLCRSTGSRGSAGSTWPRCSSWLRTTRRVARSASWASPP